MRRKNSVHIAHSCPHQTPPWRIYPPRAKTCEPRLYRLPPPPHYNKGVGRNINNSSAKPADRSKQTDNVEQQMRWRQGKLRTKQTGEIAYNTDWGNCVQTVKNKNWIENHEFESEKNEVF